MFPNISHNMKAFIPRDNTLLPERKSSRAFHPATSPYIVEPVCPLESIFFLFIGLQYIRSLCIMKVLTCMEVIAWMRQVKESLMLQ